MRVIQQMKYMMTSSNGNIFHVMGHLCGEFTGDRWIPHTKASDALMFSLICFWINDWVNNREAGDLRRYHAHYDVIVMTIYRNRPTFPHGTPSLPTPITATSPFHSHFMFISRKTVLTLKQGPVFPCADPIWSIPPSHQSTNYPSITLSQLTSPDLHHYHYMQISANTHSQIPRDWENLNIFFTNF